MRIARNMVVAFDFVLTNQEGEEIDNSKSHGPMSYLHGANNIIPALESALEGKSVGDRFRVSIKPEDGYGVRSQEMIQQVPLSAFQGVEPSQIQAGMQFESQSPTGQPVLVTVVSVENDMVTIDGNHPLAGQTLHFDVTIASVREATSEEVAHGHSHDGHHHH